MPLQCLSHEICQLFLATSETRWGPLARIGWKAVRCVELREERQLFHPRVRAGVHRGRPKDLEVRIESAAFSAGCPPRLKERFAEEQLRGHATEGPHVQVKPEA